MQFWEKEQKFLVTFVPQSCYSPLRFFIILQSEKKRFFFNEAV